MLKKLCIIILILLMTSSVFALTLEEAKYHLQATIEALESVVDNNERLLDYIDELEAERDELRERLTESNETIKDFVLLTEENQEEIQRLRNTIVSLSEQMDEDRFMVAGIGVSYPLGGTAMLSIRPKYFPVGGFVIGNITTKFQVSVSIGATYSF